MIFEDKTFEAAKKAGAEYAPAFLRQFKGDEFRAVLSVTDRDEYVLFTVM